MKVIKIISKCIFWVLILALQPPGSSPTRRLEQYKMPPPLHFVQTSYGAVVQAVRKDIAKTKTIRGRFISCRY